MSSVPWKQWSPGVLSSRQTQELFDEGFIGLQNAQPKLGESSFDLTLSEEGYRMLRGSIKPSGSRYGHKVLSNPVLAEKLVPLEEGIFELEARETYVFKLRERLELSEARHLYGEATAKSSVGRVDVLARLIVDGEQRYEGFSAQKATGDLFLEVTPITFPVRVKAGTSLSQLRLFYGHPRISEIRGEEVSLYPDLLFRGKENDHGVLTLELTPCSIGDRFASAFITDIREQVPRVDLWKNSSTRPRAQDCWKARECDEEGRLDLEKNAFHILRSKERLALPPTVASYCKAIDETIGEMRIHYAGFVHPGFGMDREDGREGTPLIFEVRCHDVNVCLNDGEHMARLVFYRMSEPATETDKSYNDQELKLSHFFQPWPVDTRA